MPPESTVAALSRASREFGPAAAREKLRLLRALSSQPRLRAADLLELHGLLDFLRAYPDDARVLAAAREAIRQLRGCGERLSATPAGRALAGTGFPGSHNSHVFSYDVLVRLSARFPGALEIDWDEFDDAALCEAVFLVVALGEHQGLEDIALTLRAWIDAVRPGSATSALEFLLALFERSRLEPRLRAQVWDNCSVPARFQLKARGSARAEIGLERPRVHFQRSAIERTRFPLEAAIRRPLGRARVLPRAQAERVLELALAALGSRCLEIYPLTYASRDDVLWVECGRGIAIAISGVRSEWRSALESLHVFLALKNGVPIAYGPASVLFSCCEMGLNMFPEFRGGEVRWLYAQFMRALHQLLGVEHFFLTAYGMGKDNEDALETGAFWFYRKLGFLPTSAAVEELARAEEARMLAQPGYRSDRRMLRRLAQTDAYFDLSAGRCRPLELGRLGVLQSRFIEQRFAGDRVRAEHECPRLAARALGVRGRRSWTAAERRAFDALATLVCMLPEVAHWSAAERGALVRAMRAKGQRSERGAARLLSRHARFAAGLRALVERGSGAPFAGA